ncbi:hypothetical protein R3X27_11500 [Tropicimonas sp. TH_r6]|uniref:hypothetical protein n=1 Tax=Tropicimonas sp. TH_r6 TaxID=3082085 RepID=UPI002955B769|nr:hypothetical protein [Tropicimonas sp. TH_r6]MDV7143308.1 hypothetical protein [Tropicimonas sp. TH_r6]
MSEFLPQEVRDEMARARRAQARKRTHMRVVAEGRDHAILRYWEGGFAVDAEAAAGLRGLVEIHDRGRPVCQALIVTSSEREGERLFEFKVTNPADRTGPPADFVRERPEPVGLLPRE